MSAAASAEGPASANGPPRVAGFVDVRGPTYRVDYGGRGRRVVLVHGLGGSHVNWSRVAPLLAPAARVVAIDLPGFGRTPPAGRAAKLHDNADLVADFVASLGDEPAIVVGNSMGGLVALATAARHPSRVRSLVLVNPSLPRVAGAPVDREIALAFAAYAIPGVGELFLSRRHARLGPERSARETLALCGLDLEAMPREYLDEHFALARERWNWSWTREAFLQAARSILPFALRPAQFDALTAAATQPTLLVHGTRDRLVSCELARAISRRRPAWTYREYEGVGHVPQLEVPERLAADIVDFALRGG